MSSSSISPQNKYDRVVLLVDMDCFYCQVEEKLNPQLKGPIAVVQYNAWRGGGIIAVNYAARAKGVTRHIRGEEAKELCPEIQLVKVPNVRGKADLSKYRDAGKEVASVLQRFTPLLERASVDEAYLDITETVNQRLEQTKAGTFTLQPQELVNTFAVGHNHIGEYVTALTTRYENDDDNAAFECDALDAAAVSMRQSDIRLLLGASIASEVRAAVKAETSYECSAGIAHNKILAKLACGMNKPNKQTILPLAQIPALFATLPVRKITGLGAKYGEEVCERMDVRFLGQLLKFSEVELQQKFDEKNGSWLYNICRGIDLEVVTPRFYSKSIGCCKNFPGRNRITGLKTLSHWLGELAEEICERLAKDQTENHRLAKQMVVNFVQEFESKDISSSRSAPLGIVDREALAKHSLDLIKANTKQFLRSGSNAELNNAIKLLGISVGKFETISSGQNTLQVMFAHQESRQQLKNGGSEESKNEGGDERTSERPRGAVKVILHEKENFKNYFQTSRDETTAESNSQNKINPKADKLREESATDDRAKYEVKGIAAEKKKIKSFFVNYLQSKNEISTEDANSEEVLKVGQGKEAIFKATLNESKENSESCEINENRNKDPTNQEVGKNEVPQVKSFFLNALRKQREDGTSKVKTNVLNETKTESNAFFSNALCKEKVNEIAKKALNDKENPNNASSDNVNEEKTNHFAAANQMPSQSEFESGNDLSNLEADLEVIENEENQKGKHADEKNSVNTKTSNFSAEIPQAPALAVANFDLATTDEILARKRKFSEIASTAEIKDVAATITTAPTSLDYQANYAEYAMPDLHADFKLDLIKCDICGAKIPARDVRALQTHQDHHFAQQLSQQQRVEYRAELQSKVSSAFVSKSPAQKKPKKSPASGGNVKSVITKFLKPASTIVELIPQTVAAAASNEPSTSHQAAEAAAVSASNKMATCADCKQLVCQTEMAEHKDYHLAKELQRKLNQLEVRTVAIVKKSNSSRGNSSSSANKSLQLSARHGGGSAVSKPINQYFSQPQD